MEEISQDELEQLADTLEKVTGVVKKAAEAGKMEELSQDELMRAPQSKPRKSKVLERSYHNWFYQLNHTYAKCSNPDCIDPRGTDSAMVAEVNGKDMCRFCFLAGWNTADAE